MDFLKKAMESATSGTDEPQHKEKPSSTTAAPEGAPHGTASPAELMSSAKVLADAAQSSLKHEDIDKPKVATAADDVLHAASKYGKLEEKGYGGYVEKADSYIHKFTGQHDAAAPPPAAAAAPEQHDPPAPAEAAEGEKSEGGFGDVMNMAKGLMK